MTRRPRGWPISATLLAVLLATIAITSAPPSVDASAADDAESVVVDLINQARANRGLVALRRHSELAYIAGKRASRMASANLVSHSVSGDLGSQLDGHHVDWYRFGETIGYSTRTYADAAGRHLFDMWMDSAPHRDLLMSARFNYVGVGLALRTSNNRTYGTVVLTESTDVSGARSWLVDVDITGNDIRWSWGGADLSLQTHTAGLRDYDVQVRAGSNPWTTVRNDTAATSYTLWNKTRGVTYGIRIRATDRRSNAGSWTVESRVTLP